MRRILAACVMATTLAGTGLSAFTPTHVSAETPRQVPGNYCNGGGGPIALPIIIGGGGNNGGGNDGGGYIPPAPGPVNYGNTPNAYGHTMGYGSGYGRVGCAGVWTSSASYHWGQQVFACYTVPAGPPGTWYVNISVRHVSTGWVFQNYGGPDDGSGDCGWLLGGAPVGGSVGWRELRVDYQSVYGQSFSVSTYYYGAP